MKSKIYQLGSIFIILLTNLLISSILFAQAPQKMSYQAVIRNSSNALITSTPVGMRISVIQGSIFGAAVYVETQTPSTNVNGLVSLEIGTGTAVLGTFAGINWAAGPYFIKTETDPTGGTTYSITGTNELMSVPYALFSANGTPGPQGPIGLPGAAGANGTNGVSVMSTSVINDSLFITLSNGQTLNAGYVKGSQGVQGAIGATGGYPVHYIGETYGGGIVFYVYDGGQHGLIAATADQSTGIRWYGGSYTNTCAKGDGVGAGLKNTAIIIANQGPVDGNTFAARLCNEYSVTVGGITYGDWYLPSKYELNLMYLNIGQGNALGLGNVGGFANNDYWSSTELDLIDAWDQNFTSGNQYYWSKGLSDYVRAVRAF
jgi:Protein of unknown function (DUF1566)